MDGLVSLRRDLHHHPEPAWCEFYTTAHLADELETRDLDALYVGPEILDADERMAVPDGAELNAWVERAHETGTHEDVLDRFAGGCTSAVAIVGHGGGPTVGLRVDIDALPIPKSEADDHLPAAKGFRSENGGFMHACGHDAHATISLGILDTVIGSDFEGTFKLFFQPSEEQVTDGKAVAEGGYLDNVDYLFALYVGLDHPTGKIVCNIDGFLAVSHFHAEFTGAPAHAGTKPKEGEDANLGAATATQSLYGISRHSDGATRISVGLIGGGTATNIVAGETFIEGEVRGATTKLMEYMGDRAHTVIESSAAIHDCGIEIDVEGKAPSARSDDALTAIVDGVSKGVEGVVSILDHDDLDGGESATYLMQHVQDRNGLAAYVGVGTDHPGGHHTRTLDVDEETIHIAVDVLVENVDRIATGCP